MTVTHASINWRCENAESVWWMKHHVWWRRLVHYPGRSSRHQDSAVSVADSNVLHTPHHASHYELTDITYEHLTQELRQTPRETILLALASSNRRLATGNDTHTSVNLTLNSE